MRLVGDPARLGQTADPADIRLNDIEPAAIHHLKALEAGIQPLTGGNAHR